MILDLLLKSAFLVRCSIFTFSLCSMPSGCGFFCILIVSGLMTSGTPEVYSTPSGSDICSIRADKNPRSNYNLSSPKESFGQREIDIWTGRQQCHYLRLCIPLSAIIERTTFNQVTTTGEYLIYIPGDWRPVSV